MFDEKSEKRTSEHDDDAVQEGSDETDEGSAVAEDLVRESRHLDVRPLEVNENGHAEESEDERYKDLVRRPRVLYTSPGQAEDGGRRAGDEEEVDIIHRVLLLLPRRLGGLDVEEDGHKEHGETREGKVDYEEGERQRMAGRNGERRRRTVKKPSPLASRSERTTDGRPDRRR